MDSRAAFPTIRYSRCKRGSREFACVWRYIYTREAAAASRDAINIYEATLFPRASECILSCEAAFNSAGFDISPPPTFARRGLDAFFRDEFVFAQRIARELFCLRFREFDEREV